MLTETAFRSHFVLVRGQIDAYLASQCCKQRLRHPFNHLYGLERLGCYIQLHLIIGLYPAKVKESPIEDEPTGQPVRPEGSARFCIPHRPRRSFFNDNSTVHIVNTTYLNPLSN